METKKSITADLEARKTMFLLIGFVMIVGYIFIALEWSNIRNVNIDIFQIGKIDIEEDIPITIPPKDPPPPAKPLVIEIPPIIEIVDNKKETTALKINSETTAEEGITPQFVALTINHGPESAPIIDVPEIMPEFPGGPPAMYEFLGKETVVPAAIRDLGIKGTVVCQFIVNTDGSIVDAVVLRGVDPLLDKEAIRAIYAMPKWTPGFQVNKKVRVRFTLPIVFN